MSMVLRAIDSRSMLGLPVMYISFIIISFLFESDGSQTLKLRPPSTSFQDFVGLCDYKDLRSRL